MTHRRPKQRMPFDRAGHSRFECTAIQKPREPKPEDTDHGVSGTVVAQHVFFETSKRKWKHGCIQMVFNIASRGLMDGSTRLRWPFRSERLPEATAEQSSVVQVTVHMTAEFQFSSQGRLRKGRNGVVLWRSSRVGVPAQGIARPMRENHQESVSAQKSRAA